MAAVVDAAMVDHLQPGAQAPMRAPGTSLGRSARPGCGEQDGRVFLGGIPVIASTTTPPPKRNPAALPRRLLAVLQHALREHRLNGEHACVEVEVAPVEAEQLLGT